MKILIGLSLIANPYCLALIVMGVIVGIIFGAIPGLTAATAVALFLPMTFGMDSIQGISMLMGLYIGGISGGLISAILLKIPGTPSSIATCFDGHPMAARGEAGKALGVGIFASFVGGIISTIILIFVAPPIASFALRFGPWEYFAVGVFSLSMIASLVSGSVVKGLASATIGLVLSMIGTGPVDAATRLTFGFYSMEAGLDLLPVMVGLFAVSELFNTAATVYTGEIKPVRFKMKGLGFKMREYLSQNLNTFRSSLIGTGIGILPGIGGGTSNILSYLAAKNQSRNPERFGTGIIDGIVASETANNATVGGALIPLLTMGIPGDGVTSLLLGALMLHGISPGPLLFTNQWQFVYAIFGAVIVANFAMLLFMYLGIRPVAKILDVPKHILFPIILILCSVGAYSLNNRIFDVGTILVIGIVGYLLEKIGFSLTPMVLGFILGPIVELNLRRGLMSSRNSFVPMLQSPIAMIFLLIAVISIIMAVRKEFRRTKKDSDKVVLKRELDE